MVSFLNESYFLHDKSNLIEKTFITEINKFVYDSISYCDKHSINEVVEIVSFNNPLKYSAVKNTIKNTLDFQLTKINGNLPVLNDKKIHNSFTERGNKRKFKMNEPIKTVIIRVNKNLIFMTY